MNILSSQPDRPLQIGRASELIAAVQPVPRSPQAESEQQRAAREPAPQVLDLVQREALMEHYADSAPAFASAAGQRAQRALSAYNQVEQGGQREQLAQMLGIDEYA